MEKPWVTHTTPCVISTERGHCLAQHRSIYNDGSVAFSGEKKSFLVVLKVQRIVLTLARDSSDTHTHMRTLRLLHHPGLYEVFELFSVESNNQSTVVV